MIWFLYNVLFGAVFLLLTPSFLLRMRRRGGYAKGFFQRLGFYGEGVLRFDASSERIWIHAVSVGEMFVALKLMERIRSRRPAVCFIVSTATSTGHRVASDRVTGRDSVIYFPIDFPWVMRRVLNRLAPSRILLIEGELWPNLIRLASAAQIEVGLVNGRLSESSFRGYRRMGWMTRRVLPRIRPVCMQSERERERMVALGADSNQTFALGSAKFDVADIRDVDSSTIRRVLSDAGIREDHGVLLGGSTWEGEESTLASLYLDLKQVVPEMRLVLVPRHAERAESVAAELDQLHCPWVRRSALPDEVPEGSVLLVDTTGELMSFYREADVIFVGKSLCACGGQNPIEPAALGKAVIVGPNMQNFPGVMEVFKEDGALIQVADAHELKDQILSLLSDGDKREAQGRRAAESVARHCGVLDNTLDHLGIRG